MILSVHDGARLMLKRENGLQYEGATCWAKNCILVLVDFTEHVLVCTFERPERAFS